MNDSDDISYKMSYLLRLLQCCHLVSVYYYILYKMPTCNVNKSDTSASVELTQTRHSHSKQLFHGGQISVFLQGGLKSFLRCL